MLSNFIICFANVTLNVYNCVYMCKFGFNSRKLYIMSTSDFVTGLERKRI